MGKKERAEKIKDNWMSSYEEDPETTREVIRNQLRKQGGVEMIEKALRNRATRFMLRRQGALDIIQAELEAARKDRELS